MLGGHDSGRSDSGIGGRADGGTISGHMGDDTVGDFGGYKGGGDIGGSDGGSALGGMSSAMGSLGLSFGTDSVSRGGTADYAFGLTEGKYAAEIAASPLSQAIAGAITGEPTSHEFSDSGIVATGDETNWGATAQGKAALSKTNADIVAERSWAGRLRDLFGYDRAISPTGLNALMSAGNTLDEGKAAFAAGMAQTNKAGEIEADPLGVMSSMVSPLASMLGFGPMGLMVEGPKVSTALSVYNAISDLGKLNAIKGAISNPATAVTPGIGRESGGLGGASGYAGGPTQSEIVGNVAASGGSEPYQEKAKTAALMPSFGIDSRVKSKLPAGSLLSGLGKFGEDFNLLNLAKSLRG